MNRTSAVISALAAVAVASAGQACIVEPPVVWDFWWAGKSVSPLGPDYVRQEFYMNVGIFDTANAPMNCACAMGISGIANWLLTGQVQLAGFQVVQWNGDCITGSPGEPFVPFSGMSFSSSASSAVSTWYGDGDVSWFAFTGAVPANSPDPTRQWAVCFAFDVHISIDNLLKNGRKGILGAGVADQNLMPDFGDPFHPFVIITSAPLPAPGVLALMGLCGIAGVRRRRAA